MSRLDLIAGPNGAGKTSLWRFVIEPVRPGLPFVNADLIAAQRWPDDQAAQGYEASRIASTTREALIAARLDFCTETVFSHPSKLDLVALARDAGYDVVLHVVMIPLALSAERVAARVTGGGHDVPAEKLAPRYGRLWPLVAAAVPDCHRTVFYDNSADDGPRPVASYRYGVADLAPQWPDWTPDPLRAL